MAAGEATLLVTRPTRLIALRYYVGTIVFFLLGGLFYFGIIEALFPAFPSGPVGGWSTHRLVGVTFAVLALLLLLVAELIRKSTRYTITDNKIIREDGILNKHTSMAPYTQLERVDLHQSFFQRILRIGTIVVDTGDDSMNIDMIPRPKHVQELLSARLGRKAYSAGQPPPNP
jgi:uncharacterized membrane protein YdbT with pleckstrin-like domain